MEKKLFTPGPLTTSERVRKVLPYDVGSREERFQGAIQQVCQRLKILSGGDFEVVLQPGSGTMGIESVIGSAIPPEGKILVIINGAYGKRMLQICQTLGLKTDTLSYADGVLPKTEEIRSRLETDPKITHVGIVHCETSTGMLCPLEEISEAISSTPGHYGRRRLIVDAMSSFGGVPVPTKGVDCLVTSANKCLQGVPGMSIILARLEFLQSAQHRRSFSLQLYDQWKSLVEISQFRFTPPTQVLLGLLEALKELEEETLEGRWDRYRQNQQVLLRGMRELGFAEFLKPEYHVAVITSFYYPESPHFDFDKFYASLYDKGFVIYPGKVSHEDTFRLGNIGHLFPSDMEQLLEAIRQTKKEMGF